MITVTGFNKVVDLEGLNEQGKVQLNDTIIDLDLNVLG